MTTTDPTAHDVLTGILALAGGPSAAIPAAVDHILDALTAAGYAVVHLPEPDQVGADTAWINERQGLAEVHLPRPGRIEADTDGAWLIPNTARALAAALLAAADHQEKNQ